MGRKKPIGGDDEDKSKKKGFMMDDDDEYSIGTELSEDAPEEKGIKEEEVVDKEAEEEEEEGPLESAASKKKKKKKKEKLKKKAAASTSEENQEETKTEINSKVKVPKHVREIQAMLAKLKEAEERKKREEEEEIETELKEEQNVIWQVLNCGEGGMVLKYDRKSDPNGPKKYLIKYAQLAIASYNKTNTEQQESQCYTVVDIIQSGKARCFGGYNVHIVFTAKLCNQDDHDAIIFTARLYEKNRKKYAVVRDVRRNM